MSASAMSAPLPALSAALSEWAGARVYELVASSELVRKPIYLLEVRRDGWSTLAAIMGLGEGAGMTPIRYKSQEQAYRSTPYSRAQIDLISQMARHALEFEEAPWSWHLPICCLCQNEF
jgi:hypothetical protein